MEVESTSPQFNNRSTTSSDEDLQDRKRRARRPVSAELRAKRLAGSPDIDLITNSRETNYINPLTKEGFNAINEQLSQRPRRIYHRRLIVPPSKGSNIVPVKIDRSSIKTRPPTRPLSTGLKIILCRPVALNGHDTTRMFAQAAMRPAMPPATYAYHQKRNLNHASVSIGLHNGSIASSAGASSRHHLPSQPPLSSLNNLHIRPTDEDVIKTENNDEAGSSSPTFIAVDVSDVAAEEQKVKLEMEDPIEPPDDQPLRYMEGSVEDDGPPPPKKYDARTNRYERLQAQMHRRTVAYWDETAQDTLRICTDAIMENMASNNMKSRINQEMVHVMAEFLKPALERLDQIEHPAYSNMAINMGSQMAMENASSKIMERVIRQEAEKYTDEFLPMVKFARAFSTFANRFASLSRDLIDPVDLQQNADTFPDEFSYYEDCLYKGIPPSTSADTTPDPTEMAIHRERIDQDRRRFTEVDPAGSSLKRDVQRRKQLYPEQPQPLAGAEVILDQDGNVSRLYRRKINPMYTRQDTSLRTYGMGTRNVIQKEAIPLYRILCPYCQEEFLSDNNLSEHVRRLHVDEWKVFAPYKCTLIPHCDFRAVKVEDLDGHRIEFHDLEYRKWVKEERMDLGGNSCPFCELHVYNMSMLHEHLNKIHRRELYLAYSRNFPFIGCGSCMFSSFWAYEVFKHWREKVICKGKLEIRKLTFMQLEQEPPANTIFNSSFDRQQQQNGRNASNYDSIASPNMRPTPRDSGQDPLRRQIRIQPTGQLQNDRVSRGADKRIAAVIVRRPLQQPPSLQPPTSQTVPAPNLPAQGRIKDEGHEDEQSASPVLPIIDEDQIKKEEELD